MDIKPTNINNVTNIYKKNMQASSSREPDDSPTSLNKDVVEISEEGLRQSEFGKTIRDISSEVFSDAPAERINALRLAVQSGTYSVSSELIANAILSRITA